MLALLLGGCPFGGRCETGGDCHTGRDFTEETAATPAAETGIATWWYTGDAEVGGDEFQRGSFGTLVTIDRSRTFGDPGEALCEAVGSWSDAGGSPPAEACPECEWAFQLVVTDTTTTGDACAHLGLADGWWDGHQGWWGFSPEYLYDEGDFEVWLDHVVWFYFPAGGYWSLVSWNYGGYGYNRGDADDLTFLQAYYYTYY